MHACHHSLSSCAFTAEVELVKDVTNEMHMQLRGIWNIQCYVTVNELDLRIQLRSDCALLRSCL